IDKLEYDSIGNPKILIRYIREIILALNKINTLEDFSLFKQGKYGKMYLTKSGITISGGIPHPCMESTMYKSLNEGRIFPSIFRCLNDHYNYQHPTQKPLLLISKLVEMLTPEGGTVLDPFAGSGTTAVACKELGRNYICIEKEREYVDIIHQRLDTPVTERGLTVEEQVEIEEKVKPSHQQLSLFG
ncbi:MAG: DNA-methyltransferase, partial [Dolichospermum sp.]